MKYLIICTNPISGVIEWNIIESKYKVAPFIKFNYSSLIRKCNYSWTELKRYIVIFEIEPNFELLKLNITKPVDFVVELDA